MTYQEALLEGKNILKDADVADCETDAWLLLEYVTGIDKNKFILDKVSDKDMPETDYKAYRDAIERRGQKIPLQHITGVQNFYGYDFFVNENVLIPRFDTEVLVEQVINIIKKDYGKNTKIPEILDICTGSGCIILSIMAYIRDKMGYTPKGYALDISDKALEVAKDNARRLDLNPEISLMDILTSEISGNYDIIVSNPPYIETEVIKGLMSEVKDHEPMIALDGGQDGLLFYRTIADKAYDHINGGGYLAFEIGYNQGRGVTDIVTEAGYTDARVIKDYAGNDRVCIARRMKDV